MHWGTCRKNMYLGSEERVGDGRPWRHGDKKRNIYALLKKEHVSSAWWDGMYIAYMKHTNGSAFLRLFFFCRNLSKQNIGLQIPDALHVSVDINSNTTGTELSKGNDWNCVNQACPYCSIEQLLCQSKGHGQHFLLPHHTSISPCEENKVATLESSAYTRSLSSIWNCIKKS